MIDFKKLAEQNEVDERTFYLLIAGSRGFDEYGSMSYMLEDGPHIIDNPDIFSMIVDTKLLSVKSKNWDVVIYHGDARGVDHMASLYAERRRYEHKEFVANWDKNGKRAGMMRNEVMYTHLSLKKHRGALLFWDGESKGTRNNFLCARNYNVNLVCYNYILQRWLTKEEVETIKQQTYEESRYYRKW